MVNLVAILILNINKSDMIEPLIRFIPSKCNGQPDGQIIIENPHGDIVN